MDARSDERVLDRRALIATALLAGTGLALGTAAAPAAAGTDTGFRWCGRCQGMWFAFGGDNGHCPVHHWWDHNHQQDGSAHYWFVDERPAPGQDSFGMLALKWCQTCKGAFFGGGPGVCPNNSAGHTPSVRTFRIESNLLAPLSGFAKQGGWRRCVGCRALFFMGNGREVTHCPAEDHIFHFPAAFDSGSGIFVYEEYFPRFL
ncbi:hypothetical protein [Allonocardiopsis opalescens]|uniref:Uncharacterized protein n=1 Tax=Allonocardiopsis opalescens TaxID=1144618 RepID=A0A2T0QBY8_9ACTN|nr:hypothetical protein [Allonocardiopsis opalescens]PRY01429.1 hypothetical protein CLV72_10111 [Allonocardiopsis opalescens]